MRRFGPEDVQAQATLSMKRFAMGNRGRNRPIDSRSRRGVSCKLIISYSHLAARRIDMNRYRWKSLYLIVSFVFSLFLVMVTVLGFTSVSEAIKAPLDEIAHWILWFFVAELIVLLLTADSFRGFLKEQWLSILAVGTSISVTQFAEAIVGVGSLTGLKAFKGIKALKGLKSLKSMKLFKATKGVKAVKSYKIGKKTSKAVKQSRQISKESSK